MGFVFDETNWRLAENAEVEVEEDRGVDCVVEPDGEFEGRRVGCLRTDLIELS